MSSNLHLGVSQEAALASLRDREGVEESRNFERAGYDHVATVAISGVTAAVFGIHPFRSKFRLRLYGGSR